jgi:cyanophycinase
MTGSLVLVGGGEFTEGCVGFDRGALEACGGSEVVVLPTAAAFEHADRVGERAAAYFKGLGAAVRVMPVLHRSEAEDHGLADEVARARFIYVTDGSPLHLRSVLKDSAVWKAARTAWEGGAVLAASGAGATVLCDPMVDPRGGAYTVGLGLIENLAVFPYHGTAADHLRERSLDLLAPHALLVGIDESTALVRDPEGTWRAAGVGEVTVYVDGVATVYPDGSPVTLPR